MVLAADLEQLGPLRPPDPVVRWRTAMAMVVVLGLGEESHLVASLRMKTLMMLPGKVPMCLVVKERGVRSVARARLPTSEGDVVAWD